MSCESEKTITEIKRGSTFEQSLVFTDENGDTVDISGWLVESDLKISPEDDVLLSFSIDDSLASDGTITISATPTQTQALPADYILEYDVKLTTSSGTTEVLSCGFWVESEIWDEVEVWQIESPWDEAETWEEEELWSCDTIEEPLTSSGDVYYTETMYLKTSRHITD